MSRYEKLGPGILSLKLEVEICTFDLFLQNIIIYFRDLAKCENNGTWCEAAQPNCNTDLAKQSCRKYCGICKSMF